MTNGTRTGRGWRLLGAPLAALAILWTPILSHAPTAIVASASAATLPAPVACPGCWRPRPGANWDIQLAPRIDLRARRTFYELDGEGTAKATVTALHRRGIRAVYYVSGGSFESYRRDATAFPKAVLGRTLAGWPDERWLDIRRLDLLVPIMEARVRTCAARGFDAVDFDNVDGYSNTTGFPLRAGDQLRYNATLANLAHRYGLGVALKNDLEQVRVLAPYFDFAVDESCYTYRECALLRPFRAAGKAVLVIEYRPATSAFCPTLRALRFDGIRKHRSLDAYRAGC